MFEFDWEIKLFYNHYRVYVNGELYCSVDTYQEGIEELKELAENMEVRA